MLLLLLSLLLLLQISASYAMQGRKRPDDFRRGGGLQLCADLCGHRPLVLLQHLQHAALFHPGTQATAHAGRTFLGLGPFDRRLFVS
jgi:hypothetical protein